MKNKTRTARAFLRRKSGVWELHIQGPGIDFIFLSLSLKAVKVLAKYKLIERGFTLSEALKLIESVTEGNHIPS